MRLKKTTFVLFVILLSLLLLCCDRYEFGQMTEEEINSLYYEIETDIKTGDLWILETTYVYQDSEIDDNLLFLQEAMRHVFQHKELIFHTNGSWREEKSILARKGKIKLLSIVCSTPVSFENNEYIIDSVEIEKCSNIERTSISLHYHKAEAELEALRIEIVLQCQDGCQGDGCQGDG